MAQEAIDLVAAYQKEIARPSPGPFFELDISDPQMLLSTGVVHSLAPS